MRIISGIHKGRRLRAPKNLPVRPTTDMAKEGLFNILTNTYDFENCFVLDLCSGTGNIAYEFCSRGVQNIHVVDKDRRCIKYIQETASLLQMPIQSFFTDVFSYLQKSPQTYDIIFADPPYNMEKEDFYSILNLIFDRCLLNENGICVVEHSKHTKMETSPYFIKSKTYGGNCFSFFEKKADL